MVCFLGILFYFGWKNYSFEVSFVNKFIEAMPSDYTISKTETSNKYRSSGEIAIDLTKYIGVDENYHLNQSIALLHSRVDPRTLNRLQTERILQDSIKIFHLKHFIQPQKETCVKRLPTALVIGVQKCGTRELVDFMHLHPHIQIYHKFTYFMPYFTNMYSKGVEWFRKQMPCSFSNQITVTKLAEEFFDNKHHVPERIQKFNASIKLILIVREPIARSYSAYSFFKAKYSNKTFTQLVITALKNTTQKLPDFLKMSIYDESMKRWLKVFYISQILIIEHNELKQDPVSTLGKVEQFLGLGHYITSGMFAYKAESGFYCIRSNLTTTGMSCYSSARGRVQDPISSEIRSKLTDYFRPKNDRFFRLIGKSFNW